MYVYEFERVSSQLSGWGFGSGNKYGSGDYREIIARRAREGWRYVGFLPKRQRAAGFLEIIDLVFERERPES